MTRLTLYQAELWAELESLIRLRRGEDPAAIIEAIAAELAHDTDDAETARLLAEGALLEAQAGVRALAEVRR